MTTPEQRRNEAHAFASVLLGVDRTEDPPPPGSRLADLMELRQTCLDENVSDAEFQRRAAVLLASSNR